MDSNNGKQGSRTTESGSYIVRPSKALGSSIDSLVRSSRSQSNVTSQIAKRTLDLWLSDPSTVVEIHPTALLIDNEPSLEANDSEGQWLLPCFMAGLRQIRTRSDVGIWDLMRLTEEIAFLEPRNEPLERFRDWLWSDGAEGFEVDLQTSFMEVIDRVESNDTWQDFAVMAIRSLSGLASDGIPTRVASTDLDAASHRKQFQMALDLYRKAEGANQYQLTSEEQQELLALCDDQSTWASVELEAVLDHPRLMSTIPPDRLAKRLLHQIAEGCDPRILEFFSEIGTRDDDYSRTLMGVLSGKSVGRILAIRLPLDDAASQAIADCLANAPPSISRDLMHGLLERSGKESAAIATLTSFLSSHGFDRLEMLIRPDSLTPGEARTLAHLLGNENQAFKYLCKLVDGCAIEVKAAMMASLPERILGRMRTRILDLFRMAETGEILELAQALARVRNPESLRLLAEVIQATNGRNWKAKTLREAMIALASSQDSIEDLVELATSASLESEARLMAIRALENQPEQLEKISRWRVREMFESREVRNKRKAIRNRLKGGAE